jgi:HEAT repeat protein
MLRLLQKRQKDEDAFTRSQAARALGRIGNHSAIEVLVKSLLRDKSPEVRREAASALGLVANKHDLRVIETLREASLQADPYLAGIAKEALDKVNLRNP